MSQALNLGGERASPLSYHLIPAGRFPQSGVWSWSDLLTKTVSGTVGVLSRLSQGGVDPFTVVVGQVICREFKLGRDGMKLFVEILDGLKCHSSMGNVMYYGFGIDSLIRQLSSSYEGGVLVLLCAALGECLDDNQAATVLWELTQAYKPNDSSNLTPSQLQWRSLLRQCLGFLSTDQFPVIAEHFMHINSENQSPWKGTAQDGMRRGPNISFRKTRCTPESIAEAILAVGKVSTGQLESIVITGTAMAGWFAALVHRFFNLRLSLYGVEGEVLFTNFEPDERAQVEIFYEKLDSRKGSHEVQVKGIYYRLEAVTQLLSRVSQDMSFVFPSGRVPWETALSLTFGSNFNRLIDCHYFGVMFGAAARSFQVVVKGDSAIALEMKQSWANYSSSGSGPGFLAFATLRVPELSPIRDHAHAPLKTTLPDCLQTYESSVDALVELCGCIYCRAGFDRGMHIENAFCLRVLAETIIVFVQILSSLTISEGLGPTRAGMEALYWQQVRSHEPRVSKRMGFKGKSGEKSALIRFILPDLETHPTHLCKMLSIFTGRQIPPLLGDPTSAMSAGGLCVYLDHLVASNCEREKLGFYSVIPGVIQMAGRTYDSVHDASKIKSPAGNHRAIYYSQHRPASSLTASPFATDYDSATLLAHPAMSYLEVGILLKGQSKGSVLLGPSGLEHSMIEATGKVHCEHYWKADSEQNMTGITSLHYHENNPGVDPEDAREVFEFRGTMLSRIAALSMSSLPNAVLRHRECLDCCRKVETTGHLFIVV